MPVSTGAAETPHDAGHSPPAFGPFLSLGRRRGHAAGPAPTTPGRSCALDGGDIDDSAIQDSGLERELRGILEGPRWQLVFSDLPRLAARTRIARLRAPGASHSPCGQDDSNVVAPESDSDSSRDTKTLEATPAGAAGLTDCNRSPDGGTLPSHATAPPEPHANAQSSIGTTNIVTCQSIDAQHRCQAESACVDSCGGTQPHETTSAATAITCRHRADAACIQPSTVAYSANPLDPTNTLIECEMNATRLIVEIAHRLESTQTVDALHAAIAEHPHLADGDAHAVRHLLMSTLGLQSRTARLVRSINQAVVITATWYLHQNLLGPAGVRVKDVRGNDGWRIYIAFHRDGRTMFVTHVRREESLPSSTDAFELEWSLHLSFDGDAVFQGAMLKLHSFEIAQAHPDMTEDRVRELMARFCHGNPVVLEQTLPIHQQIASSGHFGSGGNSSNHHGGNRSEHVANPGGVFHGSLPRRIAALTTTLTASPAPSSGVPPAHTHTSASTINPTPLTQTMISSHISDMKSSVHASPKAQTSASTSIPPSIVNSIDSDASVPRRKQMPWSSQSKPRASSASRRSKSSQRNDGDKVQPKTPLNSLSLTRQGPVGLVPAVQPTTPKPALNTKSNLSNHTLVSEQLNTVQTTESPLSRSIPCTSPTTTDAANITSPARISKGTRTDEVTHLSEHGQSPRRGHGKHKFNMRSLWTWFQPLNP